MDDIGTRERNDGIIVDPLNSVNGVSRGSAHASPRYTRGEPCSQSDHINGVLGVCGKVDATKGSEGCSIECQLVGVVSNRSETTINENGLGAGLVSSALLISAESNNSERNFGASEKIECNGTEDVPHTKIENSTESNQLFEGPIGYEENHDLPSTKKIVYGCGICFTIVGNTRQSFNQHQKKYHRISLQCKVCKRKFKTSQTYEKHMATHIRYPCAHCQKEFRHLLDLEEHQAKHFTKKLFQCKKCDEEFYLLSTLKQHHSFMGANCPEIQKNVYKIQQQLVSTQNEELVKCSNGCANMIPRSRMEEHIRHHNCPRP